MQRKRNTNKPIPKGVTQKPYHDASTGASDIGIRSRPPSHKPMLFAMVLVFGLALTTRFIYIHQLSDSALLSVHMGDAKVFDEWAQQIAHGDWLGTDAFYQAPLYPYFLATCFTLFGYDYDIVRIVQIVVGSLSCVLLVFIGRQFATLTVGLVAGLIMAIYPTAIFFDALVQKSFLSMFLMCAYLVFVGSHLYRRRLGMLSLSGIALGLACLTRENLLVIVAVTVIWLSLYERRIAWRQRMTAMLCFAAGLLLVLAPVSLRNWYVGSDIFLTTSNVGPNFYIGNGAHAGGIYRPLKPFRGDAVYERQDAREIAESKTGRSLTDAEVNRYWLKRTWQDIASSPSRWGRLLIRKWRMFWSPTEIADTESLEAYADSSTLLNILHQAIHFDTLLFFAAIGIWYARRDWRKHALLYGTVLAMALSITLFFVFSRFRHTALPIVVFFAALGITHLTQCVLSRKFSACVVPLMIGVCTYLVVGIDVVPKGYMPAAYTFSNLGQRLTKTGRLEEALAYHQKALSLAPNLNQAKFGIAVIEGQRGHYTIAADMLKKVVEISPGHADAHYLLGLASTKTGHMSQALAAYQTAVRLAPDHADAHNNLATVLMYFDHIEAAIAELQQAVDLSPDNVRARFNLGVLYFQQEKLDLALQQIEQVLVLSPTDTSARRLYEDILAAKNNKL